MTLTRLADYDEHHLKHERNVAGIKATSDNEVNQLDQNLKWLSQIIDTSGTRRYENRSLGVAIIGLGRIGTIHMEGIMSNPRVVLRYLVEDSAERANYLTFLWHLEERGVKMVTSADLNKVLSDDQVEAVIVCTPTAEHEKCVLAALNAGKAIFCEKPLAKGRDAIKRCYTMASERSLPILCAFNRRFDPGYSQIYRRVRAGEIGRIHMVKATARDSPRPSIAYLSTSGGIYQDCAVHDIDLICWVVGEYPTSVTSTAHCFSDDIRAINDFDTLAITMKFPSGAIGVIDISRHAVYGYDQRLEVFGSAGMLNCNEKRPTMVTGHSNQGSTLAPICYSFSSRYREAYVNELDHFVDMVKNGVKPEITAESTLAVDKIATAAEQSARTGQTVEIKWD